MNLLLDPLAYDFMVRALLVGASAAAICAVLSCWLVLIGWSLLGDAVSHAVLPGVVLAYIAGVPFAIGALIFGFLAVGLIGIVRDSGRIKEDAAIGIVFTSLFALGLVLISVTPSQTDLNHIIFGNLLGVSGADVIQILALSALVFLVLLVKRKDLTLYSFDQSHTHAIGLRPRMLGAILLSMLAITAVATLQAVGVVLVVAMLITPGATARLLTDRFSSMMIIAPILGVVCTVVGIYLSYYLDTATGPMIVLMQSVAFAMAYIFAPRHGVVSRARVNQRSKVAK